MSVCRSSTPPSDKQRTNAAALGEWVIRGRSSLESAKKKARRHILWVLAGTQYSDPNFESLHQF